MQKKAEELQSTLSSNSSTIPEVDLIAAAVEAKESVSQNSSIDEDSVNVAINYLIKASLYWQKTRRSSLNCSIKPFLRHQEMSVNYELELTMAAGMPCIN